MHADGQEAYEEAIHITNHKGNQMKTTMRYHLTPSRISIIKKTTNNWYCYRMYSMKNIVNNHVIALFGYVS